MQHLRFACNIWYFDRYKLVNIVMVKTIYIPCLLLDGGLYVIAMQCTTSPHIILHQGLIAKNPNLHFLPLILCHLEVMQLLMISWVQAGYFKVKYYAWEKTKCMNTGSMKSGMHTVFI